MSATLHHVVQNQPTVNTQLPPFTWYLFSDHFCQNKTKKRIITCLRVLFFHLYYFTWKKNELILKSSVKVIQESWSQMMLQKVKKSQQSLLSTPDTKFHGRVSKINEPPSCYMVCQQVTSLAESFFSKFHNCPQSFASQQNIQFFRQSLSCRHHQPT